MAKMARPLSAACFSAGCSRAVADGGVGAWARAAPGSTAAANSMNFRPARSVLPLMQTPLWRTAAISALLLSPLFGQTVPAGHWEGTVQTPNGDQQVALDLAKNDKGAWIGTFTPLSQNAHVPLADIKVDGKSVKFRLSIGGAGAPDFDCTQESETAINCTISTSQGSVTAALKRTGEAKVELPKALPAVSKELEGDWEGSLDTPGGTLKIVAHFKNQPDNSVKATMDSPDQGATGLPLNDVAQKGSTVTFELAMVGGSYKGTLNKEATQMDGEWTQGGGSLPLTLKKSAAK
jgi:hypothetical protein